MITCPSCGEQNPAGKKFCGECGTSLPAAPVARREVRKTVTILFSDVTGSTDLGERLDPESLRSVMGRYFAAMKSVVERHGGTVEKFIGDAIMAVFGIPVVHEDDALRAVRAAAEMRDALENLNRELDAERGVRIAVRTGINTGEVVAGDPSGQTLVTGDTVNVAARLEQAAAADELLLGETTYRLVRDAVAAERLEPLDVKGKSLPVTPYRLVSVTPGAAAHARRLDAPLVGRERQLALLHQAHDRAVVERAPQLFTLLGPAGVGKSRLVAEFTRGVEYSTTVLRGRCLPYGEGITYWPVGEVVRAAAGITETDSAEEARFKLDSLLDGERDAVRIAANVAGAIGLASQAIPQEELFRDVRKLLEVLGRRRPLVVVIDDVHWAEPTLLDLIEHIADWSHDVPLLLLCPARPELLDARATWGGGKLNATTILLEPLGLDAAAALIDYLPGGSALDARTRRRIIESAEGNPLFVEEMLASLVDEGYLRQTDDGWQVARDLAQLRVPGSIQALLAARLERLAPEEREVAERAAVVGRVFERGAVAELAPPDLRPRLTVYLLALVRKELVRPDAPGLDGDDAFRFRHILIRDAAYDGLPKHERADLHERFADWLTRVAGDRLTEYEEIVAYHLEQAHKFLTELGGSPEKAKVLAASAGELLARTGERARQHGDMRGAANLLERACAVLRPGAQRIEAMLALADGLSRTGSLERASERVRDAAVEAAALGDPVLEWDALLADVLMRRTSDPIRQREVALQAARVFEEAGDQRRLARAWMALGYAEGDLGHGEDAARALELAAHQAHKIGDTLVASRAASALVSNMLWSATPAEVVMETSQEIARQGIFLSREAAIADASTAIAVALTGNFDEARRLVSRATEALQDLGDPIDVAANGTYAGLVEYIAGNLDGAAAKLREANVELEAYGEENFRSTSIAWLAFVLARRGETDEARREAELARQLSADADFINHVYAHMADAQIALAGRDFESAERSSDLAVAVAKTSDDITTQADALALRGGILRAAGRGNEAESTLSEALALYEQKGNKVGAANARRAIEAAQDP